MELSTYKLNKFDFDILLESVSRCYAKEIHNRLPTSSDFPLTVFDSDSNLNLNALIEFSEASDDIYVISVIKRIVGIAYIQYARDNETELNIKWAWRMISESILELPSECTVSSIGSQGFLSIPLYKFDSNMDEFDFIRLHIWHNDLLDFIDKAKSEQFSIHSHSFLAQSWIINGKIINERYSVENTTSKSSFSLFKIEYNKTLNEVNQHTSMAVNTGQNVLIDQTKKEEFTKGDRYQIDAGKFHKSTSKGENGLSSTFFSFTTQNNTVVQSHVTGSSSLESSAINRKMHIDPKMLISAIDSKTSHND